jgi:ketosteroid isomerase-like protein
VLLSGKTGFAQTSTLQAAGLPNTANEKVVRDVYAAYEKKDWNMLTSLFANGFTFTSPVDDHIDLKAYKVRCWPNAYNIKKFDIEKLVVDGDDVFVLYNGWNNDNKEFRNTEYFKLKDGKIEGFTCFFGPGISYPNSGK